MNAPVYRFVPRPAHDDPDAAPLVPDAAQQRVIAHRHGPLLVQGGAGTGKTTTLVEAVLARLAAGDDPRDLLVLTLTRKQAARLRRRIAARRGATGADVPVFSFAAFAFAVLRASAAARGEPAPRLLKGPEQDVIIRELIESDVVEWPAELRPAAGTRVFAAQLRDLLLRATERGVSARRLAELGERHGRPEWTAAARFLTDYVDVLALRSASGGKIYDSAELVRAAAACVRDEPRLVRPPRRVFVDELQDTDPAMWKLLRLVAGGGRDLIAFGDADSATFGFRGGDARILRRFGELFPRADGSPPDSIALTVCHRAARAPFEAASEVARRLRGSTRYRATHARDEVGPGAVSVISARSRTQQAAHVATLLRQARLQEGVRWSEMAVLVKSAAEDLPVIERALRQAGIPVELAADDRPLSTQPVVRHLLTIVQCGLDPKSLDEDTAVALLHSAYGGADALTERKLRQELRRAAQAADVFRPASELLVEALRDPRELTIFEEEAWARPAVRIAELLDVARRTEGSVEDVLWAVWESAGLDQRLARRAVSNDGRAAAADADLDAMMTLFDWAADFTDRLPGAGADVFADHVLRQQLPADSRADRARIGEAVSLLTAHAAKGREWDLVVIAGVQEGGWPNLRPRGSLWGAEFLAELLGSQGEASDVDTFSVLLDEERRLFHAACSRARDRIVVTCVSDDDENQPSRFVEELGVPVEPAGEQSRLDLPGLIAQLRLAAANPGDPDAAAAVGLLSRLAAEGVAGADPADWWGLRQLSDDRPLALPGERLAVSPSAIEMMDQCGLRWMLEKHGGDDSTAVSAELGNLMHAAAEHAAQLPSDEQETAMNEFIAHHADQLPSQSPWTARRDRDDLRSMTTNYLEWLRRNDHRFLAAERRFTVDLPSGDTGAQLRLSGVVDRLEADLQGRVRVVDLKTGARVPSKSEAETNRQLAAYQLAVESGAFGGVTDSTTASGASLVFLRKEHRATGATQRDQPPPADPRSGEARDKVIIAAQDMTRRTFTAVHGAECRTCRVKHSCPLSGKGDSVTG